jgi:hypothetical protein
MSRSRTLVLTVAVLLIVAAGAAIWRPSAPNAPPAAPIIVTEPATPSAPATPPAPAPAAPQVTARLRSSATGYVGSEKCAECHDDEHAAWRKDWPARALSEATPIYYHVTGKGEWVDYSVAKQGALTTDHPFFCSNWQRNAQHSCLDCHVTGLNATYDWQAHRWSTGFADAGVACESCHGPGARHVETQLKKDIVQPPCAVWRPCCWPSASARRPCPR